VALRSAYTLIEILVVLLLIGLSAALALPMLTAPVRDEAGLSDLVGRARRTAIERGETLYLRIEPDGEWTLEAGGAPNPSLHAALLEQGRSPVASKAVVTLRIAPVGSCAFDVRTLARSPDFAVDLPSCDVRER
jgi:prepilin-type N-terminal cleavage/methylation domain-containing protein